MKSLYYFFKIFGLATASFDSKSINENIPFKPFIHSKIGITYNVLLAIVLIAPNGFFLANLIRDLSDDSNSSDKPDMILKFLCVLFTFVPPTFILYIFMVKQENFVKILDQMVTIKKYVRDFNGPVWGKRADLLSQGIVIMFCITGIFWAFQVVMIACQKYDKQLKLSETIATTFCLFIIHVSILQYSTILCIIKNAFVIVNRDILILLSDEQISLVSRMKSRFTSSNNLWASNSMDEKRTSRFVSSAVYPQSEQNVRPIKNINAQFKLSELMYCRKLHGLLIKLSRDLSDFYSPLMLASISFIVVNIIVDSQLLIRAIFSKEQVDYTFIIAHGFSCMWYLALIMMLTNAATITITEVICFYFAFCIYCLVIVII